MRISTESYDIGYSPDAYEHTAFVDGVEQKYCLTADTDRGFCVIASQNEDGSFKTRNGDVGRSIVFGKVTVEKI